MVVRVFNELIQKHWDGFSAVVLQDEAVKLMVKKGLKRRDIFSKNWLDIESLYGKAGWSVVYDRPGYCESYPAQFIFSLKK